MWGPAFVDIGVAEFDEKSESKRHRLVHCASRCETESARASREPVQFWQGWKESNLRMPESKSGALTNLATPLHGKNA